MSRIATMIIRTRKNMQVYELIKELKKIPHQDADVVVTTRNIRNVDSVTTSLKQVVTFKDIAMLKGDLNG